MRRPPNPRARWTAAHPVRGALLAGVLWGAFMGIWTSWGKGDVAWTLPSALAFGVLFFGPGLVWLNRRAIRRWDAENPAPSS